MAASNERTSLLTKAPSCPDVAGPVDYSAIGGDHDHRYIESAPAGLQNDPGFRSREYARLRRVVLLVVGATTVFMVAGLMVGLLVPVESLPADRTEPTLFLPVP